MFLFHLCGGVDPAPDRDTSMFNVTLLWYFIGKVCLYMHS